MTDQSVSCKGSFRNPPPGKPKSVAQDDQDLKLEAKVDDLHDPVARKNFRLVIIIPESVEQTDLNDPANGRRYLYTYDESTDGGWRTDELWP